MFVSCCHLKRKGLTNSNRTVSAAGMLVSEATDLIICTFLVE